MAARCPDGVWHRLGLVVDAVAGTYTAFVDGVQVQQNSGVTLDGRFALGPDALLFADENQENAAATSTVCNSVRSP